MTTAAWRDGKHNDAGPCFACIALALALLAAVVASFAYLV
jgi:hypothetical protein